MFFKLFLKSRSKKRIYLDFASSTPIDQKMMAEMPKLDNEVIGANPSALYREGVLAKEALESARAQVAKNLNAREDEIIFTGGATESDNLAIIGTIQYFLSTGIKLKEIAVFVSKLEHAAVTEPLLNYIKNGIQIIELIEEGSIVDSKSLIIPKGIRAVLVSCMYVNNEIGTVQPVRDIAKRIRFLRKENQNEDKDMPIVFHVDATQAPNYYSLRVDQLGVDMMTLGSTKLYCNKGVGILYKKRGLNILPIMHGGGQEFGLRPGTQALYLIHQFAWALNYAQLNKESENARIRNLQKHFEEKILEVLPVIITGSGLSEEKRSPHISHIAIKDFDSELLVIELDALGISVSAKSACKNEDDSMSPLVEEMYGKSYGAIRFSFGRDTVKDDLNKAIDALFSVIKKYSSTI